MNSREKSIPSKSKLEDIALIDDALAGDQSAFEKLMNKYYQHIFNLIYKMIFRKEDVEDLTQEAFIKAFNSLENFDRQFAFSTWLYKIATNNCIDYLRKKKLSTFSIDKEIASEDSDFKFEIPDTEYVPDNKIIEEQRKKIIDEAIENLPEKYKKVIVLRHKKEMEYEEIAEKLELPLGTVKAHIFRGRELLNKYLKNKIKNY
ncbi:MAG: sigma-70 family RNA polymerase sigma factor [Ignavibacteriae bacterium]|nr:sigma-70 family RNA polymerase sigma factor [Ignavibacteriota bacterium]MCB0723970.1 sigma-70 family RNA polymerase sigma factor [Ignavibacteriota bacterium]MCB9243986.1 sigma-70 family RNA polymerase sigma factor [Ignavibacteriales bacterium]